MPHHSDISISGTITHVFGHRFVVRTTAGDVLADLTPRGLEKVSLQIGDAVTLEGEQKPSEVKVARLTTAGTIISIDHHKPHHDDHHHTPADPAVVEAAARAAGFEVIGQPRRKPRHFEVLGKRGRTFEELHIELDGHIRKSKPVERDELKWRSEIRA